MILDESLFSEAMYTNISSDPYDLNIIKHKIDADNARDWTYIKSFKFKDDAIERANRMIANGEAYVAQVYSWKNEDHGEIYFRKADDGKIIDKSIQHVDCDVHGPEIKTVSDKTIIKPVTEEVETQICVICKKEFTGYGNNAHPVAEGRCCDICNASKVIPARIAKLYGIKLNNINEGLDKKYTTDEFLNMKEDSLNAMEHRNDPDDKDDIADVKNDIANLKSLKNGALLVINSDKAFICENEDSIGKQIKISDAQEFLNTLSDLIEVSCNDTLKTCTYKIKKAEEPIKEDVEPNGKDALGFDTYKYKQYTIVHFPLDFEYNTDKSHIESYLIQSPIVLSNSNYHLPLRAENENGEEINFNTLEDAKAWIDKYDGKFKLEVKYGNEIHAVIKDEFITESLTEDTNTYNSARLHVTTNDNYSYYFNFKTPVSEEQINSFKQKVNSGEAYWLDIKKEFDCEEVQSAKELNKPTAIIKSRADKDDLTEDVTIVTEVETDNNGLATIINQLIKDEFDAIQQYNDAIVNFETEGRTDLVQVLTDILHEENLHVGQLEVLLEQVNGVANSIDQGKAEAETQLANERGSIVEEDPEEGMHY